MSLEEIEVRLENLHLNHNVRQKIQEKLSKYKRFKAKRLSLFEPLREQKEQLSVVLNELAESQGTTRNFHKLIDEAQRHRRNVYILSQRIINLKKQMDIIM